MPHLSPLMWMLFPMFIISFLMLLMSKMYFQNILFNKMLPSKNKTNKNFINYKMHL